jgi:hypothetical protein
MKTLNLFGVLYAVFHAISVTHGQGLGFSYVGDNYSEWGDYRMCEHERKYCGYHLENDEGTSTALPVVSPNLRYHMSTLFLALKAILTAKYTDWPMTVIHIALQQDKTRPHPWDLEGTFRTGEWKDTIYECDTTLYNKKEWWPSDRLYYVEFCGTGQCRNSSTADGDATCAGKPLSSAPSTAEVKYEIEKSRKPQKILVELDKKIHALDRELKQGRPGLDAKKILEEMDRKIDAFEMEIDQEERELEQIKGRGDRSAGMKKLKRRWGERHLVET